jgi:hypothetical protein
MIGGRGRTSAPRSSIAARPIRRIDYNGHSLEQPHLPRPPHTLHQAKCALYAVAHSAGNICFLTDADAAPAMHLSPPTRPHATTGLVSHQLRQLGHTAQLHSTDTAHGQHDHSCATTRDGRPLNSSGTSYRAGREDTLPKIRPCGASWHGAPRALPAETAAVHRFWLERINRAYPNAKNHQKIVLSRVVKFCGNDYPSIHGRR